MKINTSGVVVKPLAKSDTKVGEVYTCDNEVFYFRCQGGFVNLTSGSFMNFSDVTDNVQWRHLADAIVVVNG